jgi:hypothetical protein
VGGMVWIPREVVNGHTWLGVPLASERALTDLTMTLLLDGIVWPCSFESHSCGNMSSALYQEMLLPSPTSIRLLKATPNDSASSELSYSLSAFELQDIPSYSALSYTWGNPLPSEGPDEDSPRLAESHSIHCNGCSVGVKLNLFESLISLAKLQYEDYIWIDALCIDQTNLSERNSQVSLMGKIYSKALGIIIWLGRESSDTQGIVWLHNYFIPTLRDKLAIQPEQFQGSDATRDLDPKRCQDLGLDSPTFYAQSYAEFCRRSWFTRTWIVQEVAMASRVRAVIGNVILEWWDMINLAHLFQANRGGIGFHFKTKLRISN